MEELARLALLLIVAALVINLVAGGTPQVKTWFSAKFIGDG